MFTLATIRVQVGDIVKTYPADVAGYGDHLVDGGTTLWLSAAQRQAHTFFADGPQWVKGITFWAVLDDSGLAYRVEIRRSGSFTVQAAAPMPGHGNVRELYLASGYDAE